MFLRRLQEYNKFLRSLLKTTIRLIIGMWRLTKMPHPAITIFGGARIAINSPIAQKATIIAQTLAGDGFSIITGGGPGIMEAANLGAIKYLEECNLAGNCQLKRVSVGIGLVRLNKDRTNPYVQENIVMDHFFARKWLLVRYSVGFIVFPGGFGTLDELFEIITLVQCNRMERLPIILIDTHYWQPFIEWINTRALEQKLIGPEDAQIVTVTDDVNVAIEKIRRYCTERTESANLSDTAKK